MGATIRITAPARIHLGFLDLHGGLGRRFGSLGLAIDGIAAVVRAAPARSPSATGPFAQRAAETAGRLAAALDLPPAALTIEQTIPAHAGLGSGTQLDLAVGVAITRAAGRPMAPRALAGLLERGARSGIGLGAFETGGLLLDGGRGAGGQPPPIIARLDFPADWRVLLVHDTARTGLHAAAERTAFARLPPFPEALAERACRLVLMAALPAAAEGDLDGFGQAVAELQRQVGDHFAAAQGGRFTSPEVGAALAWLQRAGFPGIGQSSWGPTGFAFLAASDADAVLDEARRAWARAPALRFELVPARNRGALIEHLDGED